MVSLLKNSVTLASCLRRATAAGALVASSRGLYSPPENKLMRYSERRVLGFSALQMHDIVVDVSRYHEFVPWCVDSAITNPRDDGFRCKFTIGFPPLTETYASEVTHVKPTLVKSVALETKLFTHLITTWKFTDGYHGWPHTCTLDYSVSFRFTSSMYSAIANSFLDEVVHRMVDAFLHRAEDLYGPPDTEHTPKHVLYSKISH